MNDPGLSNLLKWGITNSNRPQENGVTETSAETESTTMAGPRNGLDPEVLAHLLGGPSDADRMRDAMAAIQSPDVDLKNKLTAFDNFEQLIENLDNANNMEVLQLWVPLVEQLDNLEPELQFFAAWCIGTAVQNNSKSQDKCLAVGAVPKLVKLAISGATPALRKKATYALSSEVRNHQPGLDAMMVQLPADFRGEDKLDAEDMAAVDVIINRLRDAIPSQQAS